jgi:hypothetical protein
MEITSRSKNEEIAKAFEEQLKTGQTILYSLEPTSNPEYSMGYFIQKAKLTENTTITALALGWSNDSLIRTMQNFKTDLIKEVKVGDTANKIFAVLALKANKIISQLDIHIRLIESQVKKTWTNKDGSVGEAQPKTNPTSGEVILINGEPVYRYTELVNGKPEHVLVKADISTTVQPIVKQETIAAENVMSTMKELAEEGLQN